MQTQIQLCQQVKRSKISPIVGDKKREGLGCRVSRCFWQRTVTGDQESKRHCGCCGWTVDRRNHLVTVGYRERTFCSLILRPSFYGQTTQRARPIVVDKLLASWQNNFSFLIIWQRLVEERGKFAVSMYGFYRGKSILFFIEIVSEDTYPVLWQYCEVWSWEGVIKANFIFY